MLETIKGAILARCTVRLSYPPGERVIEPHALGKSADGNLLLRAFQVSGASASGEHKDWKLFRLDRATKVVKTETTFAAPRAGYRRGDSAMKGGILAQL